MKVLIVDDNADDRKFLRFNLEYHGCEVLEATNGAEGLHLASLEIPDIIISDALMPIMDGFQFLRNVREMEALQAVPFIFYSAVYTEDRASELADSLRASAFIVKPMDPEEFWDEMLLAFEWCKKSLKTDAAPLLIERDEVFLRKYGYVVAAKLEQMVAELVKAKAEIEGKEKSYRQLFSSLRDVVITTDCDRTILDVNQPALKELFGYELEDIAGRKTAVLYADEAGYNLVGKEIIEKICFEKGKIIEVDFRKKNGEIFDGELYAMELIGDEGEMIGYISLIRDITKRKLLEVETMNLELQLRQSQKMESIGTLAGGVAHDFNNILTAIIGYGEMTVMKMAQDDPLRHNIDCMMEGCQRAARLTKDLLLFSRKQAIDKKQVDINDVVLNVQKFLRKVIGEDIDFDVVIHAGQLPVLADAYQLEQVLMNLATNARDAMSHGGRLTLTTDNAVIDETFMTISGNVTPGSYALITFADSGTGMDEKTRLKVFEPFFTTKEVGKGTGLGLAVVYGIIKQHDGFICLESEPGAGTTIKIYLPLMVAPIVEDQEEVLDEAAVGGSETILLAEDDEAVRNLTKAYLSEFGYTVIEAVDGLDAVIKFEENSERIDLLLFDLIMPKMNGKETLEKILQLRPGIKAIFFSGYSPEIVMQKVAELNGYELISKPVTPLNLLWKVRSVLNKSR